jgi:hypothetical protein
MPRPFIASAMSLKFGPSYQHKMKLDQPSQHNSMF